MRLFNNNEEELAYIYLMISPALIGIVAVLSSISPDGEVNQKMLVAMFLCFMISLYFAIQYKLYIDEKKKRSIILNLQKELGLDQREKKNK